MGNSASIDTAALQQTLHDLIPLSRTMQVRVETLDENGLTLRAPLEPNHNHAGTAFAGSLYSLASLAGWAMLRHLLECHGLRAELVLSDGRMRYRRPVDGELSARVELRAEQREFILDRLNRGRAASIELSVELAGLEASAATFEGRYFARP